MRLIKTFKSWAAALAVISVLAVSAYALTSVEIKSHPDSTNAVKVVDEKLRTISMPYLYAISEGIIDNHFPLRIVGANENLATTNEVLWDNDSTYVYLASAETLKITSTDVDDDGDPADTGARTLYIWGLDTNYDEINDTITMNGTTAVDSNVQFLRVFGAYVTLSGTSQANEGVISIKNNAGTNTLALIRAAYGGTLQAIWTVPADHIAYITNVTGSTLDSLKPVHTHIETKAFGSNTWRIRNHVFANASPYLYPENAAIILEEKTDIQVSAHADQAGAIASVILLGWYEEVE
jgi:hypothetical protein